MKIYFILCLLLIFLLGFTILFIRTKKNAKKYNFALEFRERFIKLANHYGKSYDSFSRKGNVNHEEYYWLTKNVNKMQGNLGTTGIMDYLAPFQAYQIPRYEILINTIPKFKQKTIEDFDINVSDDALIRHLGILEESIESNRSDLKNPFRWFQTGFHEILSLPLMILNWFGIIGNNTLYKIMANNIYKFITGLVGLITFISAIVTIIQGKEAVIKFVNETICK